MQGFDWRRVLIGAAPWTFLLEVLVRLMVVYFVLVIVVRLLGKRLSGRIGNVELAVMLALGAIVAVPIQDPVRGVVPGLLLLVMLLALQWAWNAIGARHPTFERATQNTVSLLVADGVVALDQLREARISVSQLFAVLRSQGLNQLGEARRVYLEAYGCFSVFRQDPPRPGLPLTPSWDRAQAANLQNAPGVLSCGGCGTLRSETPNVEASSPCPTCQAHAWVPAVKA